MKDGVLMIIHIYAKVSKYNPSQRFQAGAWEWGWKKLP